MAHTYDAYVGRRGKGARVCTPCACMCGVCVPWVGVYVCTQGTHTHPWMDWMRDDDLARQSARGTRDIDVRDDDDDDDDDVHGDDDDVVGARCERTTQ